MYNSKIENRLAQPVADILASLVKMPLGTRVTPAQYCPGLSNATTPEEAWTSQHVCKDHCRFFWCGPFAIYIEYINKQSGDFSGPRTCGEGANQTTWIGKVIGSNKTLEIWEAIYGPSSATNPFPPYEFNINALVQCDGPPLVPPYAARSKKPGPEWKAWKQIADKTADAVYRHRALHGVVRGCMECSQ